MILIPAHRYSWDVGKPLQLLADAVVDNLRPPWFQTHRGASFDNTPPTGSLLFLVAAPKD
jgi:hypothetical protein